MVHAIARLRIDAGNNLAMIALQGNMAEITAYFVFARYSRLNGLMAIPSFKSA